MSQAHGRSCCPSRKSPQQLLEPREMHDRNSICDRNQGKDAQSPLQWLIIKTEGGEKSQKMSIYMPCT